MTTPTAELIERLEGRRNALLNSFGFGAWVDGRTAAQLGRIDGEIAFLRHRDSLTRQAPAEGER